MRNDFWKRILSALLALVLLCTNVPVGAFAAQEDGLCAHHTSHADCGYREAREEIPCDHEHTEACSEEACAHTHGACSYAEAVEAASCDYLCQACAEETQEETAPATEPAETVPETEPAETLAEEVTPEPADEEQLQEITGVLVNPLYADVVTPEDILAQTPEEAYTVYATRTCTDPESMGIYMRDYMEARYTSLSVRIVIPYNGFDKATLSAYVTDALETAFEHTGVPTQGDYLNRHYSGLSYSAKTDGYTANGDRYVIITLTIKYYTTASQERILTQQLTPLVEQFRTGETDFDKIKNMYDYICQNVVYDYANLNNDSYTLKYSAYAALVNKTAVCQGYASLLYRIALEMGIDCRYISGTTNSGRHGWNIILLNGKYYNLDSTWDAGLSRYRYFLVTDNNFPNHYRGSDYTTADFYARYPMSDRDYIYRKDLKILREPENTSAKKGQWAQVSVEAEGDGVTYQWYRWDADKYAYVPAEGFTTNTFQVQMSEQNSNLYVYCKVSDKYGDYLYTNTVNLTMDRTYLQIITQPESVEGERGQWVTLTVEAQGDDVTYQWYYREKNQQIFVIAAGCTGNTYQMQLDDTNSGRTLYCEVQDAYGNSDVSDFVTVSLKKTVLQILRQPESTAAKAGDTAVFSVEAQGDSLTYQWYYRDREDSFFRYAPDGVSAVYEVIAAEETNGREVYCVIRDIYGGSVTSDTVNLTLKPRLQLLTQPQSVTVNENEKARISFEVQGEDLTYSWYWAEAGSDRFKLTATYQSNFYEVKMDESRHGRQVYCVVTDGDGNSVRTDTVTLSMHFVFQLVQKPESVEVSHGETARVELKATGEKLTYQWFYEDPTHTKFYKTTAFTGNTYQVPMIGSRHGREIYCLITDAHGNTIQTETVRLTMEGAVQITRQPQSVSVAPGKKANVDLEAVGEGLSYQWYWAEAGSNTFRLTTTFRDANYKVQMNESRNGRRIYCVVTDEFGCSVRSDIVTLSLVHMPLEITRQPVSVSVKYGETAKVTVEATGDDLTYQWYFKENNKNTFNLTESFKSDYYAVVMNNTRHGRQLYCVITDMYGNSVQTETVTISMTGAVKITRQPQSVTVAAGKKATVDFTAEGEKLTYQWYWAEAGSNTFKLTTTFRDAYYEVQMNESRNGRRIYCVVTDQYGNCVRTDTVTLQIGS